MKKIYPIRKTFIRQRSVSDCGVACLCMLLQYCGRTIDAIKLQRSGITVGPYGLSLREMRELGASFGLKGNCVEMEPEFLRKTDHPCILHVVNDFGGTHFEVCYGGRKRRNSYVYLMANPATQFYFLEETHLLDRWQSRAAIYFEDLAPNPAGSDPSVWKNFVFKSILPGPLLLSIPLLHIIAAVAGICITLAIQRGFTNISLILSQSFWWKSSVLLLLINLFRTLFNRIRQSLSLRVQQSVHEHLVAPLLRNTDLQDIDINQGITEINSVEQGITAFLFIILSDGVLVFLLLAVLFFLAPISGLIISGLLVATAVHVVRNYPLVSYELELKSHLLATFEQTLTARPSRDRSIIQSQYRKYIEHSCRLGKRRAAYLLIVECIYSAGTVIVFAYSLFQVRNSTLSFLTTATVVVVTMVVFALSLRILDHLFAVIRSSDALLQLIWKIPGLTTNT